MPKRSAQTTPATTNIKKVKPGPSIDLEKPGGSNPSQATPSAVNPLAGKKVAVCGVLMWKDTPETTWWLQDKEAKLIVESFDATFQPIINSKTDLVLLGSHARDDGWEGSKRQKAYKEYEEVKVVPWIPFLKDHDAIKSAVKERVVSVSWDAADKGYKKQGLGRTAKVLGAKYLQEAKERKEEGKQTNVD